MKQELATYRDLQNVFLSRLSALYDASEIRSMVHILFEEYLHLSRVNLHLSPDINLSEQEINLFSAALEKLAMGCPLQYITGTVQFNGLLLKVNPAVLIPRPETEELAILVKECIQNRGMTDGNFLDIGTGSGCLAIYLKKEFPGCTMHALDVSTEALDTASDNARSNNCNVTFHTNDILSGFCLPEVDLIVSNPPYVLDSEKSRMRINITAYEPASALYVGDDSPLVFYHSIAAFGKSSLKPGGWLWFEINEKFAEETCKLLKAAGYSDIRVYRDFRGKDRFISSRLQRI
jgi:release factor glutamine methyltransferase